MTTGIELTLDSPDASTAHEQTARSESASTSRRTALIAAGGIAALLAVGVVAFIGARLAQPQSAPPTIAASAEFNIASIAATGTATDGDLHSTPRDCHPTRCTADHHHPTSDNTRTNSAVR